MGYGQCEFFVFSEDGVKSICQQVSLSKKRVALINESILFLLERIVFAFDIGKTVLKAQYLRQSFKTFFLLSL